MSRWIASGAVASAMTRSQTGRRNANPHERHDVFAIRDRLADVDQLIRRISSVVVAVFLIAATSGCVPESPATGVPTVTPSPVESQTEEEPMPLGTPIHELTMSVPDGVFVLGQLSSTRGTAETGPLQPSTPSIAVYVRCYGTTELEIDIEGVASFPVPCVTDEADPGTLNVFDVRHVEEVTVRGSSENSNIWALAVTEFAE